MIGCLRTRVCKQPIIALHFEYFEARFPHYVISFERVQFFITNVGKCLMGVRLCLLFHSFNPFKLNGISRSYQLDLFTLEELLGGIFIVFYSFKKKKNSLRKK